ncbi:zinc-binding dehydrogenase [Kitasatospora sp. NPDC057940]|uniref:zinc-binding dehydrogenase n=1 Tax=Kitasatospora sp. NPDC057940 TaxID=3346285 RepID=UPI0036DBA7D2
MVDVVLDPRAKRVQRHRGALADAGEVAVEVERTFPLEQAGAAHARGEAGRTRGKLVLTTEVGPGAN